MATTIHQQLAEAGALAAWEPLDGHAIVTCKIRRGATNARETCMYAFVRGQGGWVIYMNPGAQRCVSWEDAVDWFCRMYPIEIDLLTTV